MKYLYSFIAVMAFLPSFSQNCAPPTAALEFSVNNLSVILRSGEVQFTDLNNSEGGFEAPAGSGVQSMYAGSFWMGGVDESNQLKLSGDTYGTDGTDFFSGPLRTDGSASVSPETCEAYDQIITVCEYESLRHLEYFNCFYDPDCDDINLLFPGYVIPPSFFNYPAHGNTALGQDYYLAPFYDYNQDGNYFPEDGDCPLFFSMLEDSECSNCNALGGHKATFWITNDKGGPNTATGGEVLGVEIHNVVYGYSSTNFLNDVVFAQKRIIDRGTIATSHTYLGIYADLDIGNPADDLMGCDIGRNLAYGYNADSFDEPSSSSPGYGEFPPALGIKLLDGISQSAEFGIPDYPDLMLTGFSVLTSGSTAMGTPQTTNSYYNYLKSIDLVGQLYTVPGTETTTNWMNAGDTYSDNTLTWFDDQPGDKQILLSIGDFNYGDNLAPGLDFDKCITSAYIHSRSFSEDQSSLEKLLLVSDSVQMAFDDCFSCVPPRADIQWNLTGEFTYQFYNIATADSYLWEFSDGSTSNGIGTTKTFGPNQSQEVTLTLSNECGTHTQTISLDIGIVGIDEEIEALRLEVFPNPAQNQISLSSEKDQVVALQLFDTTGKLIFSELVNTNSTIDLSGLASGHYIISATDQNNTLLLKDQLMIFKD